MNTNLMKLYLHKLSFLIVIIVAFTSACLKEVTKETKPSVVNDISNMNDLVVPNNFDWENSREVNFEVSITDTRFNDEYHTISIYDENPLSGGKLIARGAASTTANFITKLQLANIDKRVFVSKVSPDNSEISKYVDVLSSNISVQLGFTEQIGKMKLGKSGSPDCVSGCTQTITSNNSNIVVNNGDMVCVTGSNITIGFNANGGTIKICGSNVTVQNATLNNTATLIISNSGNVTFNNLSNSGSQTLFENWGTAVFTNQFSPTGNLTNNGLLTFSNNLTINNQANSINNGTLTINNSLLISGGCVFTNNSSMVVNTDLQLSGIDIFINNCNLLVKGNYKNTGTTQNYGYIKVNNLTTVDPNSEIGLFGGAMFRTKDVLINGLVKGYTSTSLFKVNNISTLNSKGEVLGFIQYCDINGLETNTGTIGSGAVLSCSVYLPVTTCNKEGNSSASASNTDSDKDGVADDIDEYPNDITKAYNNYYPANKKMATLAFEDMWPYKGDYDLNDLVIGYKYNIVTNATNMVVQVNGNFILYATGGSFQTGFGVEFPISSSNASGITGATLETGQSKAVVILFNNSRKIMQNWNTDITQPISDSVNFNISFNVSNGPTLKAFGLSGYNPFIWNNSPNFGRGYEIHLPGKLPTTQANKSLFGTGSDDTNIGAGRYYISKTSKLPWAINIPNQFDYPVEKSDINSAYIKFSKWVQTNAVTFNDWYLNQNGYRIMGKYYIKPKK